MRGRHGPPSCSFTNMRAARGERKESGECALTAAVFDHGDHSKLRYTVCASCKACMCCDCLDRISNVALQHGERIQFSAVWKILLTQPWRAGSDPIQGFTQRAGGGGTWNQSSATSPSWKLTGVLKSSSKSPMAASRFVGECSSRPKRWAWFGRTRKRSTTTAAPSLTRRTTLSSL